jgi:hypothetical protein
VIADIGCGPVTPVHDVKDAHIPNDSELEQIFVANKADFERLVQMSDHDSRVTRIAFDFTWVMGEKISGEMKERTIGFSQERWNVYKAIFSKLGLEKGINRSEDGSIIFFYPATNGLDKGYMFSRKEEDCIHGPLDNLELISDKRFVCKDLDRNWYLYVSR